MSKQKLKIVKISHIIDLGFLVTALEVAHYPYFKVMDYFRPGNVMVRGIALI